ncbi:MAG: nickel pincer cofactor biosynthesis protein LarB [Butyrivibrio sp.]|nr:nickel pincer cofactor biosynthesis protein LarB [Butyrivibrio sp.]
MENDIRLMLEKLSKGEVSVDEALLTLKKEPFDDIGYAKLDTHRNLRKGVSEVIYGAGKTPEQIAGIIKALKSDGQEQILITRMDVEKAELVKRNLCGSVGFGEPERDAVQMDYHEDAHIGIVGGFKKPDGIGKIVVATGGTSDIPVAEEAALTAEFLGNEVTRIYDVGVAGLHRTLAHLDDIMSAKVLIAIAGMEGALASVLGGLCDCPVIAVPTSVGYGASFGGVSALLSMLNSCASGVSVVNIDNGFGAAYQASLINHVK